MDYKNVSLFVNSLELITVKIRVGDDAESNLGNVRIWLIYLLCSVYGWQTFGRQ